MVLPKLFSKTPAAVATQGGAQAKAVTFAVRHDARVVARRAGPV